MTHDWFASTSGDNTALADQVEGFNLVAFPPPASTGGVWLEEHRRIPVKPDGWAIGATNEHPVETMQYFDFWFTPEGSALANFGVEGQNSNMFDGKPTYTEEVLSSDRAVNSQMYVIGAQMYRGYPQDYEYELQWTNELAQEGIAPYEEGDDLTEQFLGVSFNPEEQAIYDRYWPLLQPTCWSASRRGSSARAT